MLKKIALLLVLIGQFGVAQAEELNCDAKGYQISVEIPEKCEYDDYITKVTITYDNEIIYEDFLSCEFHANKTGGFTYTEFRFRHEDEDDAYIRITNDKRISYSSSEKNSYMYVPVEGEVIETFFDSYQSCTIR
ncbi:MAG: hypothetical protein H6621_00580 [Halobacteriovoraceae bacterium]|nr:hypothetical protein [Halobacteriovoraceae bacterium]MCB9093535.1 hypothetical protein [Halobacteriovoraceae bacterium]